MPGRARLPPPPRDWTAQVGGDPLEAFYLWHGLSANTRQSYGNVPRHFIAFSRLRGWPAPYFPAPAWRVSTFVAYAARAMVQKRGGLATKTLKRLVTALRSWHIDLGLDDSAVTSPRVERVIRGAHRWHGTVTKAQPLPITLPILRRILQHIRSHPSAYGGPVGHLASVAAFTLLFACFMRMGEVTYTAFDGRFDLTCGSLTLPVRVGDVATLTIPASKTDPFRAGVTVVVPTGPANICPVRACRQYLACRPHTAADPLFAVNGAFPRSLLTKALRNALNSVGYSAAQYSGHSFRRGAATWAASIGMTATEIKTLGRWNSECFRLYVDAGPPSHASAGRKLLSSPTSASSLPQDGVPQPGQVWRPSL